MRNVVTWLALMAAPAAAQMPVNPLTIDRQTQVMGDAIEVCGLQREEQLAHAQRNSYSYQETVLLESACHLVEDLVAELAAYRALDELERAIEDLARAVDEEERQPRSAAEE